jgi:sulfur-oxidizing protein SoxZ
MAARIQLPREVARGQVIPVRVLIQHPMETGYRLEVDGRKVPKNVIRSLVCRYNGVEVFRAEMSPGIAANPFVQFSTLAVESGELEFSWVDDQGKGESAREPLKVA